LPRARAGLRFFRTDYHPIQAVELARFKGESCELFGDVMHAESS